MGLFARLAADKDAHESTLGPLIPSKLFFKAILSAAAAVAPSTHHPGANRGIDQGDLYRERERERVCDLTVDTSAIRGSVVVNATDIATPYYPQATSKPQLNTNQT